MRSIIAKLFLIKSIAAIIPAWPFRDFVSRGPLSVLNALPDRSSTFKAVSALSKLAQQNQDQKDDYDKPEAATAVVAGSIEGTTPNSAETTQQDDDQDNEQDRSNGHGLSPMGMHLPIASSHATNKPAGTKRHECRGVGAFLDGMADIILSIHSALVDRLRGIWGSLFRLAIEILGRSFCLIDNPFNLAFGVAGDAAKTFLRFAAKIFCSADYAIFVHWNVSLRDLLWRGRRSRLVCLDRDQDTLDPQRGFCPRARHAEEFFPLVRGLSLGGPLEAFSGVLMILGCGFHGRFLRPTPSSVLLSVMEKPIPR